MINDKDDPGEQHPERFCLQWAAKLVSKYSSTEERNQLFLQLVYLSLLTETEGQPMEKGESFNPAHSCTLSSCTAGVTEEQSALEAKEHQEIVYAHSKSNTQPEQAAVNPVW